MSESESETHTAGDAPHGPRLPDVVDEAGATPRWVPQLGLALLALAVLLVAALQLSRGDGDAGAPAGGEAAPEAAPEP